MKNFVALVFLLVLTVSGAFAAQGSSARVYCSDNDKILNFLVVTKQGQEVSGTFAHRGGIFECQATAQLLEQRMKNFATAIRFKVCSCQYDPEHVDICSLYRSILSPQGKVVFENNGKPVIKFATNIPDPDGFFRTTDAEQRCFSSLAN